MAMRFARSRRRQQEKWGKIGTRVPPNTGGRALVILSIFSSQFERLFEISELITPVFNSSARATPIMKYRSFDAELPKGGLLACLTSFELRTSRSLAARHDGFSLFRADELPSIPRWLIDLKIMHLAFFAAGRDCHAYASASVGAACGAVPAFLIGIDQIAIFSTNDALA
jgi:hypothetical protein